MLVGVVVIAVVRVYAQQVMGAEESGAEFLPKPVALVVQVVRLPHWATLCIE